MPLPELDFGAPSHANIHAATEVSVTQVTETTDIAVRHGEPTQPEHVAHATHLAPKVIDTVLAGRSNLEL